MRLAVKKTSFFKNHILTILCLLSFLFSGTVNAQEPDNLTPEEYEIYKVWENAFTSSIEGPANVSLIDQANLSLPENYLFIPAKEGAEIMRTMGNRTDDDFLGLIISQKDELRWFITIDFIKAGYIRDGEAKEWKADELLAQIKEGTESANKERIANGYSPLEIAGWIEVPTYNTLTHQLIWSILAKNGSSDQIVNFNTYALGREGFFDLTLVTPENWIEVDKSSSKEILSSIHYNDGKRYQDFVDGTDKVATYGLAALITGVAAKKLGLLALAGAFLLKLWKLVFIIPLLLLGKIKDIFSRKKS